jgi:hypothetical protein
MFSREVESGSRWERASKQGSEQQKDRYSITSSALARIVAGILMPCASSFDRGHAS